MSIREDGVECKAPYAPWAQSADEDGGDGTTLGHRTRSLHLVPASQGTPGQIFYNENLNSEPLKKISL